MNLHYTLDQLEEARLTLEDRIRGARADLDFLYEKLGRLVALDALGGNHGQEIKEVRQKMGICQLVIAETPAALVLIKNLIGEAKTTESHRRREEEAAQARLDYFRIRKELIANPERVGKPNGPEGRMNALSLKLGRDAATGKSFNDEFRRLVEAATEYCHIRRDTAFTFNDALIPE